MHAGEWVRLLKIETMSTLTTRCQVVDMRALAEAITDDYHLLKSAIGQRGGTGVELLDQHGQRKIFSSLAALPQAQQFSTLAGNTVSRVSRTKVGG